MPVCAAGKLVPWLSCRVVFVESIARIDDLSLTGKLLHGLRIADAVCVQWPKLSCKYKRVRDIGFII